MAERPHTLHPGFCVVATLLARPSPALVYVQGRGKTRWNGSVLVLGRHFSASAPPTGTVATVLAASFFLHPHFIGMKQRKLENFRAGKNPE